MFYRWEDLTFQEIKPGVRGKTISGEKASISYFELDPGALSLFHSHHNEQINYVIQGELEFTTPSEKKVLKEGEVIILPSDISHQVKNVGKQMAINIGVLSPPRGT